MEGVDELGPRSRQAAMQGYAGRLGTAGFRCAGCGRSQWVDSASVYGLRSMPEGRMGAVFEGPCLICRSCGSPMYREGDPRLKRPLGHSSHLFMQAPQVKRVPVCLKSVCDAVVATPESRLAVLNLETGEIFYFSRRSRRLRASPPAAPGPYGKELDDWLHAQPDDYAKLPEFDSEERRALMRQFVRTLGDDRIRERLVRLTEGRHSYAVFRQGLSQHPWHEGRWLDYSRRYVTPLVSDWLRTARLSLETTGRCR